MDEVKYYGQGRLKERKEGCSEGNGRVFKEEGNGMMVG